MKRFITLSILLATNLLLAQTAHTFGKLKDSERQLTSYPQDTTAVAVVLYEKGENFFKDTSYGLRLFKKVHRKVKVLKKQGTDQANIGISYYVGGDTKEKVSNLKVLTHNGIVKTSLNEEEVYDVDINERWAQKRFAAPGVKVGSVIEYSYELESPYFFNFNGWQFQGDIPKITSEFHAKIPGNFVYNRVLSGYLKLAVNEATIKKKCFTVSYIDDYAACEVLTYIINDIPAFDKKENYMLAKSNYISKIEFELSEMTNFRGVKTRYTKTWKDADKEFKNDKELGKQLKRNVLTNKVPESLFFGDTKLEKAQNIFTYVQDHYTWNGEYSIYKDVDIKKAFQVQSGNVGDINISLINLLKEAAIDTKPMLLSTRQNGIPKQSHPVISDFNYIVALVNIEGKEYLLDATEKSMPFGFLPFRCLNYIGRVLDFKTGSYWYTIKAFQKNKTVLRGKANIDLEDAKIKGGFQTARIGYPAFTAKKLLATKSQENYYAWLENKSGVLDFDITAHEVTESGTNEKQIRERINFEIDIDEVGDFIYINPFFYKFFHENPFVTEKRKYPIDFAYARFYNYSLVLENPSGYSIQDFPKDQSYLLPDNKGRVEVKFNDQGNTILVDYKIILRKSHYAEDEYPQLKQLFSEAVDISNNSLIVFKKV